MNLLAIKATLVSEMQDGFNVACNRTSLREVNKLISKGVKKAPKKLAKGISTRPKYSGYVPDKCHACGGRRFLRQVCEECGHFEQQPPPTWFLGSMITSIFIIGLLIPQLEFIIHGAEHLLKFILSFVV